MRYFLLTAISVIAPAFASAQSCPASLSVGFRIADTGGVKTALWYPTTTPQAPYNYRGMAFSGVVAPNAPVATCTRFPLVVFSHGAGACGTQSIYFTEELARRGYIVAAPDHDDALCSVDGSLPGGDYVSQTPFANPNTWTDQTYVDRKNDIQAVLNSLLANPEFQRAIDPARIAAAGHSLGGYVAFGIAGGWPSWKDPRIKAALGFVPYVPPFLFQNMLPQIKVPVMYQGGTLDYTVTPAIARAGGAYDRSNAPKYFVEFLNQGHLDWTLKICGAYKSVSTCIASVENARLINEFSFRFFAEHLLGQSNALSTTSPVASAAVNTYRAKEQ